MSSIIKKVVRVLKCLFLALVLLFVLLVGAVNLPFVHKAITKKTNTILSEKGLPVHIGKISLLLNGKIGISQIEIIKPEADTVVYAGKVSIDLRPLPLLSKEVIINSVHLSDAVINILTDSVTGEINIVSVFKSTESPPKPEVENVNSENKDPWDIKVKSVKLKKIRFIYSDPPGGMLVKENLAKAEIDFDSFSLLNRQIDVENIEIDKPVGMVSVWEGSKKKIKESESASAWKFSGKNLEISDLIFTLDQPDNGQRIDVTLKEGKISLEKLDLATSEILVNRIKLNKPEVTFTSNSKTQAATAPESTPTFTIPAFSWKILAETLEISDGNLDYKNSNTEKTPESEKWLPVHELNASFENIGLTPAGYTLNLENLSFDLADKLKIKSGSLKFSTDSLQNIELKTDLSALVAGNKISGITKETQFDFSAAVSGSTEEVQIENVGLKSSNGLNFNITGKIAELLQMPQSPCDLRINSGNITRNQLTTIVKLFNNDIKLPDFESFMVSGTIKNSLYFPVFTLNVNSSSGNISAGGNFDIQHSKGRLDASFTEILLSNLFGETLPEKLTGKIKLNGDIDGSNVKEGEVLLEIDSVTYKNKTTGKLAFSANALNNDISFNLAASDSSLSCNLDGRFGWTNQKEYNGDLKGYFDIDLFELNLSEQPFSGKGNIDARFDFSAAGISSLASLSDFTIRNKNASAIINKTEFEINSNDSLLESHFKSDFLSIDFHSQASLQDFNNAFGSTQISNVINLDSTNFINLNEVSNLSPFSMDATLRYDPVFTLFLPDSMLNFSDIGINIHKADTNSSVEANVSTNMINYKSVKTYNPKLFAQINKEHILFQLNNDSTSASDIKFGKSGINFDVNPASISGNLEVFDNKDSLLHQLGIKAKRENDQVIFRSATPAWLINRMPWQLSTQQFLTFDNESKDIITSLNMVSVDKQIELKGNVSELIELSLKNVELTDFAIPGFIGFMPDGEISGNVRYKRNEQDLLDLNLEVKQMKWENVSFNQITAVGHMLADSTGIKESRLLITADDSLSVNVQLVTNSGNNEFGIKSNFNNFHFQILEPFLSGYANNLHGTTDGEINIENKNNKMMLNGAIRFNDFGLKIIPLQTWLTIPDNKISITNNLFLFDNFTVIDSLNRPLTVNGKINFVNNDDIRLDLNVKSDKISLMNTAESKNAPLYGSVVVNSLLNINGSVYSPTIKGRIELASGTNLTYQLIQDLSVEGSQTEVVFASITDSLQIIYPESGKANKPTKMPNIETTISINPNSTFNVKIADLYNVDISITGNGLLNYNMLPNNTMSLNGDYNIEKGDCNLKITGWPLKNFAITQGSSIGWNGSVEDPVLNLEATTKVKGSYVNPIDNKNRVVDFIVSMQLKNQLSELEIVFDVQSNDQYITSVLSAVSSEEMMRQAVNLLLFETIEIPGFESSSNYMASQIGSFWESQLNALTSENLKNTKLSFGIDTYSQSTASGGHQDKTSFTYEMEHKFLNDRATVRLSGKLNDYNEGTYQTNSLFENFIFEYALDSLNTKNLKLFQKRDFEDMLEGEVVKYGFGFLYRKNYKKLSDIWRRKKNQMPEQLKNSKY